MNSLVLITSFISPGFLSAQKTSSKPSIDGFFDTRFIAYNSNSTVPRRDGFSYFFTASPVIKWKDLKVPVSITLSDLDRESRQPFSRFGLSPQYKKLTTHFGYRNLNFSEFTLAGHTIYGVGMELKSKKWDIGLVRGRLNKATKVDSSYGVVQPYDFDRRGTAIKIAYGTAEKFIKLDFIGAKDDSSSNTFISNDSLLEQTPAGNFVSALETRFPLTKKLFIHAKGAYSIYTANLGSQIELPEEVIQIQSVFRPFVVVNASSELSSAVSADLNYKASKWGLGMGIQRIAPEFKSMGAYYFNDDLLNMTISPSFVALKNKWRFNGSIGLQRDNVNAQKIATTQRLIGMMNSSFLFSDKLSLDVVYTNFQSNTAPEVVNLNNRYLLASTTQSFSINPRYIITGKERSHLFFISYNANNLIDRNSETEFYNEVKSKVILLNYVLNFVRQKMSMTFSPYTNSTISEQFSSQMAGFNLGLTKVLLKDKLRAGGNFSNGVGIKSTQTRIANLNLHSSYSIHKNHRLNLRINWVTNRVDKTSNKVRETTGEFGYAFNF